MLDNTYLISKSDTYLVCDTARFANIAQKWRL